jgi:hypothetical protein
VDVRGGNGNDKLISNVNGGGIRLWGEAGDDCLQAPMGGLGAYNCEDLFFHPDGGSSVGWVGENCRATPVSSCW